MRLWSKSFAAADLNAHQDDSASGHLGIVFSAVGPDWIEATMPIGPQSSEADGLIAAGALAILAETIGSTAATMAVDTRVRHCLGQSLTVRQVSRSAAGPVTARATRLYETARSQLWQVEMRDADARLLGLAEMAMAVVEGPPRTPPAVPLA